jgi:hypothetical protein
MKSLNSRVKRQGSNPALADFDSGCFEHVVNFLNGVFHASQEYDIQLRILLLHADWCGQVRPGAVDLSLETAMRLK